MSCLIELESILVARLKDVLYDLVTFFEHSSEI